MLQSGGPVNRARPPADNPSPILESYGKRGQFFFLAPFLLAKSMMLVAGKNPVVFPSGSEARTGSASSIRGLGSVPHQRSTTVVRLGCRLGSTAVQRSRGEGIDFAPSSERFSLVDFRSGLKKALAFESIWADLSFTAVWARGRGYSLLGAPNGHQPSSEIVICRQSRPTFCS